MEAASTEAILKPTGGSGAPDAITGTAASITVVFSGFTIDLEDSRYDTYYSKRFVTQTSKSGTSWTFEHNIFQNQAYVVNGTWYLSGNANLTFNLWDNYFRNTESTNTYYSNGIAIWGTGPSAIDVRDNVWENTPYTAMNINNCTGVITNNVIKETRSIVGDWFLYQQGFLLAGALFDLDITNNTFDGLGYGIILYGNVDGSIDVKDNIFNATYYSSIRASSQQFDPSTDLDDVVITGNSFTNFEGTVGVDFQIASGRTDGQIINATCNWWGTDVHQDIKDLSVADAKVVPYETTEGGECACNLTYPIRAYFRPSRYGQFNVTPNGGTNGSIMVLVQGAGIPPYSYNWTGPSTITGTSGTGLKAGSYFLEVTDSEGCKSQAGPWNLRQPN